MTLQSWIIEPVTLETNPAAIWCARCRRPVAGEVIRENRSSALQEGDIAWTFVLECHGERVAGGFDDAMRDRLRGRIFDHDAVFHRRTWWFDDAVWLFTDDEATKLFAVIPPSTRIL